MQINSEQLITQLDNFYKLYFIYGDEVLLVNQTLDIIYAKLAIDGFNNKLNFHIDIRFNFIKLNDELVANDLFANKKILHLRLDSLNYKITNAIINLIANIKNNVIIIISTGKLTSVQQKSKWLSHINQDGLIIKHVKIYPQNMKNWVTRQMKKIGLKDNNEIAEIVANFNQANLLGANNELQKLYFSFKDSNIDIEKYNIQIKQQSIYDIYNLIDSALKADITSVINIYHNMNIDLNYLVNSLYIQIKQLIAISLKLKKQKTLAVAMQECYVWQNKTTMISQTIKRHSYTHLQKLLLLLGKIDRSIKGRDSIDAHDFLLKLLLLLAGKNNGLNY